jgi:DNA replication protein DnaD
VNLAYMNKMLERWYDSGFATVEDIQTKDAKPGDKNDTSYGDGDEFFEAALKAGFEG